MPSARFNEYQYYIFVFEPRKVAIPNRSRYDRMRAGAELLDKNPALLGGIGSYTEAKKWIEHLLKFHDAVLSGHSGAELKRLIVPAHGRREIERICEGLAGKEPRE